MLTRKQLECYNAIYAYRKLHGVSPTYEEISGLMGLNSKSSAFRLVASLEERGALERIKGKARAFRLLELRA